MVSRDAGRTTTGLTLQEAEQRIESLEAAAARAVLIMAEALRNRQELQKHGDRLIECVDLLFTELQVEGVKHSEFVQNSLARTASAVAALRAVHAKPPNDP